MTVDSIKACLLIDEALAGAFGRSERAVKKLIRWEPANDILAALGRIAAGETPPTPILAVLKLKDVQALRRRVKRLPSSASVLVVGEDSLYPSWATDEGYADVISRRASSQAKAAALLRGAIYTARRAEVAAALSRGLAAGRHLKELNQIGVALSTEHNQDRLLGLIVSKSRELTAADAGSLYLVERDENLEPTGSLFFKVAQNDSQSRDFSAFRMPINPKSIAGYVALSGKTLNIPDVYDLPAGSEYEFNRSFDQQTNYRSKSMLVVPMINHEGLIIGVLQLINKKRDFGCKLTDMSVVDREVHAFSNDDLELVTSLASQAAVAIENAQLYEEISRQFESFIMASVSAIEQRDPTTAGHSERVATLTVALAEAVDRVSVGKFAKLTFSREQIQEIRYAGLLHDFGKIGVREDVLVKAKKLYPHDLRHIEDRYRLIRKTMKLRVLDEIVAHLRDGAYDTAARKERELREWLQGELAKVERYLEVVRQANEPSVLPEAASGELREMLNIVIEDPEGEALPLLLEHEYRNLSIPKGSLNDDERLEIESHVTHTFRFLQLIPWTRDLRNVANIAYGHHEKLDGSGYPRAIKAAEIPVQTRMMTISDIFDALTATDRPYKGAVPLHRALDIIKMEVEEGKLDPDLFKVFVEAKVFAKVPAGQHPA